MRMTLKITPKNINVGTTLTSLFILSSITDQTIGVLAMEGGMDCSTTTEKRAGAFKEQSDTDSEEKSPHSKK